jgi:hypothetical protein
VGASVERLVTSNNRLARFRESLDGVDASESKIHESVVVTRKNAKGEEIFDIVGGLAPSREKDERA